jgi:hypothetical protein
MQVLRESIANKSLGVTTSMLRGHEGPLIPAERLQGALRALTQPITETEGNMPPGNYIVFAARNKAASIPCSPRKRGPPEADPKGRGVSASRRSGASSASHLHRCVCMYVCMCVCTSKGRGVSASRRSGASSTSHLHRCVCMYVCTCVCERKSFFGLAWIRRRLHVSLCMHLCVCGP